MPKTPEKSPLSLVSADAISPPRPLGTHGTALWNSVMREYRIEDRGGVELLAQACSALDRAEDLAAAIAEGGPVVRSRGGIPRSHPAVKDELALRAFVVRTLERLGLNVEVVKTVGHPTRPFGWAP